MKKILSILIAGAFALLATSCLDEDWKTFNPSNATPPVINSYSLGDKDITVDFTPGVMNTYFNSNIPVNHTLVLTSVNGNPVNRTVSAKVEGGVMSTTNATLSKLLINMGYPEGSTVSLEMLVRAMMQGVVDNGSGSAYVDSQGRISINGFEVVIPAGSPYMDYTDDSPWSVTGALSAYEVNWDGDLNMWSNGSSHVAAHVILKAGDEFKFRKDQKWAENMGGDFSALESEFSVSQDGPNIKVGKDGVYDLWLDTANSVAWITEAFDPYPNFTEASTWSVIGSIAYYENSWNKDYAMVTDGTTHIALGMVVGADDEFKFRKDQAWSVNLGGAFSALGTDFDVTQDGPNIKVGAEGVYDLIVDPAAGTARIEEASGAKISSLIVSDEPEPEPEPVTGWNLIGFNGDWENDVLASEINGVWTVFVTNEKETTFKWRKDGAWTENYGGSMAAVGEAFEAVPDGSDIALAAGSWKIELDPENKTIKVTEVVDAYPDFKETSNWSVIGSIASRNIGWDGDVSMRTDGTWHVAEGVALTNADQFKFRQDQDWAVNIGAAGETEPFVVTLDKEESGAANGKNLAVAEDGVYDILVNPDAGLFKVVVSLGGYSPNISNDQPEPEPGVTGWNIIGLNGDWENDIIANENGNIWTAYVSVAEATEFKWRKDAGWDENYGGDMVAVGEPFDAVAGGNNIPLGPGFWKLELDSEALKITVSEGKVWSLIGDFNGWGGDVDMVQGEDGNWVAENVALTPAWKLRYNHDWAANRGGTFSALGEPFAVTHDGANIDCGEGNFTVIYNPEDETITVTEAKIGGPVWSVIGANGDWGTDYDMTEVMPGVWISPEITTTTDWKVRYDHGWDANRGGSTPSAEGVFVKAVPGGDNIGLTGTFRVVYNANNETIGTLVWGVVGSVASIEGFNWNNDVPMNLGSDGKWYSIPVVLGESDEIKIRKYAAWDDNRGGDCGSANTAFAVANGGNNIKAPADGTYMLVYDPEAETITLSTEFWGLIGDFNNWGSDVFMICNGGGQWAAYGQSISGGWKIRQGAGWNVNRGGTFAEKGTAFGVEHDGANINVGDLTGFDVIYDSTAETITVK